MFVFFNVDKGKKKNQEKCYTKENKKHQAWNDGW